MDWQPIKIVREKPRSTLTFNNIDDLEVFVNREIVFWAWVPPDFDTNNGSANSLAHRYQPGSWTNNLRQSMEQWRSESDPAGRQRLYNQIADVLERRFGIERFLSAVDPEAGAVAEIGRSEPNVAGAALAVIHGQPVLADHNFLSHKNNAYGAAKGVSILAGIDPAVPKSVAEVLQNSLTGFDAQASSLRSLAITLKSDEAVAAQARDNASNSQLERQDALFGETEGTRQKTFERLKSDIEALTAAYETKMQLRGPVRYWEAKAKRHHKAKWILGISLSIYSLASLYYLHWAFDQAAAHLPTQPGDPISYAALFKAGAFALVLTSVAFWVGRVLLRVFLSNQHLATDADERTTMTMTFLALVRSKSIKDEERQLILTPLFKSAADGIVKDDTSPDTAFAAFLSGLIKEKKA